MKIPNVQQIIDCDRYTIENEPINSIDLMERASFKLFDWITQHYSNDEKFYIFAGTGNNGGDALALARLLYENNYKNIDVYILKISNNFSPDCNTNIERAKKLNINIKYIEKNDHLPKIQKNYIVIDGIFGSGLSRDVIGYWADLINHINKLSSEIISIDLPSGVFSDDNTNNNGAKIEAKTTLMFQFSKLSNLFVDNYKYFGEWHILDIELDKNCINNIISNNFITNLSLIKTIVKQRPAFAHKGNFGHALLVAGSSGKMGASILSAKATLHTGVGLLTVSIPKKENHIIHISIPEAMTLSSKIENSTLLPFNAIGIGPGIGKSTKIKNTLFSILKNKKTPIVLDADALNIISDNKDMLNHLPQNCILTPHPKEFDRLTKKHSNSYNRYLTQIEFSKKHNIIVVLKGRYTSISTPTGDVYFNTTGNPGMATAGSGDVLTGIILSLLAQNYTSLDSAILGVYLHGLSGDIAEKEVGQNALIASNIIENIGNAFINLHSS